MGTRTYRHAGVDIEAGEALVEAIRPAAERTRRPEVLSGLGGFGGLFALPEGYRDPVLVAGTDGVGTKLLLGIATGRCRGLGQDLVAMCVNDVIVCGAEPLFFLDYYATGRLDVAAAREVVEGIAEACALAGCALLGGETAEMPGFYAPGHFDLAGFAVGVVERSEILGADPSKRPRPGDVVLGLASTGPHSNGYSLLRRLLEERGEDLGAPLERGGPTLADALLAPTTIYVRAVRALLGAIPVRALAHVTGGGLPGNLPRTLPAGVCAHLDPARWERPVIFDRILEWGVPPAEAYRTFNMGLGFCAVVPEDHSAAALDLLEGQGIRAFAVGGLEACEGPASVRIEGVEADEEAGS